ncbi:MAG: hypothetical protein U0575_07650 [Phycisphaerales bacterium]
MLVLAGGSGNGTSTSMEQWRFPATLPRRYSLFDRPSPGGSTEVFPWVFNVVDMCLLAGMGISALCLNWVADATRASQPAAEGR